MKPGEYVNLKSDMKLRSIKFDGLDELFKKIRKEFIEAGLMKKED